MLREPENSSFDSPVEISSCVRGAEGGGAGKVVRSLASLRRPPDGIRLPPQLQSLKRFLPGSKARRLAVQYKLLASSPFFSRNWYLAAYRDVAESGLDPLFHYLVFGAAEGRDPGPDFDGARYLEVNPDVRQSGANPLLHFLSHGGLGRSSDAGAEDRGTPRTERLRITKTRPTLWFFVGDTLDWLKTYPQVEPIPALAQAGRWCRGDDPEVSILIVNWNAAPLTLECVRQIWSHTEGTTYEIVIADNGSAPSDVRKLRQLGSGVRLLELGCNRYFGEANNIAAEAARGRYLCLLNNDAFVQPGWLPALVKALEEKPEIGVAGPMFLNPDGSVQEAGATIDAEGHPVRLGRGQKQSAAEISAPRFVDYISAAALLLSRALFLEAGGFDLAYEPAYYEDTDLCFKIQALGRKIRYCPEAKVIHLEGQSANNNPVAQARRKALGNLNRSKFVSRWGEYLRTRDQGVLSSVLQDVQPPAPTRTGARPSPTAAVYMPHPLTPGGAESYLLNVAAILARRYRVSLVTPHRYANLRLRNLGGELRIDLSDLKTITSEEFFAADPPDVMVAMDRRICPGVEGRGKVNIYCCQFPFKMAVKCAGERRSFLDRYQTILVDSEYTRAHVYANLSAYRLPSRPIAVVAPPVRQVAGDAAAKKPIILSVGRFLLGGHSKRHDALIAVFKSIASRFQQRVELHIAGSWTPVLEHMGSWAELMASAEGFPIHFHFNPSAKLLDELYRDAAVYWQGTGLGADLVAEPEEAGHFGISLVEAMSAQAVPFSLNAGAPREIVSHGENGFLYGTTEELAERTLQFFTAGTDRRQRLGAAAGARAADFSREKFTNRINDLVERLVEKSCVAT
jgi:GT2 family glycosyltransferase/glycosyltransferase involved in cell wall biosynthesis